MKFTQTIYQPKINCVNCRFSTYHDQRIPNRTIPHPETFRPQIYPSPRHTEPGGAGTQLQGEIRGAEPGTFVGCGVLPAAR